MEISNGTQTTTQSQTSQAPQRQATAGNSNTSNPAAVIGGVVSGVGGIILLSVATLGEFYEYFTLSVVLFYRRKSRAKYDLTKLTGVGTPQNSDKSSTKSTGVHLETRSDTTLIPASEIKRGKQLGQGAFGAGNFVSN